MPQLSPSILPAAPGGIPLTHAIQSSESSQRTPWASVIRELGHGGRGGCLGPSPQRLWSYGAGRGGWQFECSGTGAGMGVLRGPEGVVSELVWKDEQEGAGQGR